jgi:hypothetical protein
MGIVRVGWRWFVLAALATFLSACDVIGGASIDDIVLTTGLNADFCPLDEVTSFSPESTFYCSLKVSNLRPGSTVSSRWYYAEQFIDEVDYEVRTGGSGCVGFELSSPDPWPRGRYRVEIYLNGRLEREAAFVAV